MLKTIIIKHWSHVKAAYFNITVYVLVTSVIMSGPREVIIATESSLPSGFCATKAYWKKGSFYFYTVFSLVRFRKRSRFGSKQTLSTKP